MSLRIFPAKVENLRSQPGCLQRYLSGPLHVNVSSPRGAAGLCNNACLQRYLSGPLHVNVSSPRGAAGLCNNAAGYVTWDPTVVVA
ncbi:hypothetical protein [Ralstonia pseudosolanacearum]